MVNGGLNQADLARKLGVTRARVTQVLRLLDLAPEVSHDLTRLGDPLPCKVVSERALRPLVDLPLREQKRRATRLIKRARERLAVRIS
jgi:transcriptional regulator with XRE-family HTH domain